MPRLHQPHPVVARPHGRLGFAISGRVANDAEGSLADPAPVIATLVARLGRALGSFPHDPALPGILELPRFLVPAPPSTA
ncbi:MAG: hypothetical protein ACYCVY_03875 [Acidiferrobacteraceae bacterium]